MNQFLLWNPQWNPPNPQIIGPPLSHQFSTVLDEEVASVKDSVTSGLPARGPEEGVEASGSGGRPAIPEFKFARDNVAEDDGTEGVKKMAFVPQKIEQMFFCCSYQWILW